MEGTGPENERFQAWESVNGYADDMALVGNSAAEATTILHMLDRFLAYYGMELMPQSAPINTEWRTLFIVPPPLRVDGATFQFIMGKRHISTWVYPARLHLSISTNGLKVGD
jgi:hypothetical protein